MTRRATAAIVGREAELDALRAFVDAVADGAAALVLEGEAGVGKTTLWEFGVAEAETRGLRVLAARPAESETALSFAGLGDLLDPVHEEALVPLPETQRRALSRALVLDDGDEGLPSDPHSVGVAFLNAIRALAESGPLLIAVDDLQWLDAPSSSALLYAVRRVTSEPVGVLVARRVPHESAVLDELRRSLATRTTSVAIGPLADEDLQQLVHERLSAVLPRAVLREVHHASGGNPFYALELVRMLQSSGQTVEPGRPLPVPAALHDLVDDRLLALPEDTRAFLLTAAAYPQPTIGVTEAASGVDRRVGLTPALEAGIVLLDGDRVRFSHSLLAASAYDLADPLRRREIHARLADLLPDAEVRAGQLAASSDEPSEAVAAALEAGARQARARGAPQAAAGLLDRAYELTPPVEAESAVRRGCAAATMRLESGDAPRAAASLSRVIEPLPPGRLRAQALMVLARIRTYDAPEVATELFLQAIAEAGDDPESLAVAHEGVASCRFWLLESLDDVIRHADVALTHARAIGDDAVAGDVLISRLGAEALLGRPSAAATAERALALDLPAIGRRVLDQPLVGVSEYWLWTDDHERARTALAELLRRAQELGDESSRPYLLFLLGQAEAVLGALAAALARAIEGQEAADQSGQGLFAAYNLALQGLVLAQLGRPDQAREAVSRALGGSSGRGGHVQLVAASALGHLELVLGEPAAAVAVLEPAVAFVRRESIVEPSVTPFVVDQIEALIGLGRITDAVERLSWYEENVRRVGRISSRASALRCHGLLAAAQGRLEDAIAAHCEALACHVAVDVPLDRGRTLLALGVVQRRLRRRGEARRTLGEACDLFEQIGAALWLERARAELRRISGRAASTGALTPAEERVAVLVAQGMSNREVGAALFLSERTVEGHLSRVFGKLGVRQRSQLAQALPARQTQGMTGSNTGDAPVSTPTTLS